VTASGKTKSGATVPSGNIVEGVKDILSSRNELFDELFNYINSSDNDRTLSFDYQVWVKLALTNTVDNFE
jgi:hypothetical protein